MFALKMGGCLWAQVPFVSLTQKDSNLVVSYQFSEVRDFEHIYVSVYLQSMAREDSSGRRMQFAPAHWQGDTAMPIVESHVIHTVTWENALPDLRGAPSMLRAVVEIDSVVYDPNPAGMRHALASLLVPGLGSNLVSTKRKSHHVLITLAAYTFMGVGLANYQSGQREYQQYSDFPTTSKYARANRLNQRGLVLMGIGGAIWLTDLGWALWKGAKNQRQRSSSLQVQAGIGGLGLQYRF